MFIAILGTVLGLMHLYVWKRLIKDTTQAADSMGAHRSFRRHCWCCWCATLLLPRLFGWRESAWLAWPGYVWFGLIVYLFLTLLVLEPVRLALRGWVKRRPPDSD